MSFPGGELTHRGAIQTPRQTRRLFSVQSATQSTIFDRRLAAERKIIVRIENIQHQLRAISEEHKEQSHFWFSLKAERENLEEAVRRFKEKVEKMEKK